MKEKYNPAKPCIMVSVRHQIQLDAGELVKLMESFSCGFPDGGTNALDNGICKRVNVIIINL
jgi:hypothetical protein